MDYPATGKALSDADLIRYSGKHLKYEIDMFFRVGIELDRFQCPDYDATAKMHKNALVESFATHLRNLLLFLYPHGTKGADVISDYFFNDPIIEWKRKRPNCEAMLEDARNKASREVSHLTVLRRDDVSPWPVPDLMEKIKATLKIFIDNASTKKLDPSVKSLVDAIDVRGTATLVVVTNASTTAANIDIVVPSATNHINSISSQFDKPR